MNERALVLRCDASRPPVPAGEKAPALRLQAAANLGVRHVVLLSGEEAAYVELRTALRSIAPGWTSERFGTLGEACRQLPEHPPDLLMLDVVLAARAPWDAVIGFKTLMPAVPVILLAKKAEVGSIGAAFAAGAGGYLVMPIEPDEMARCLAFALKGEPVLCRRSKELVRTLLTHLSERQSRSGTLTTREEQVMECLLREQQDKEIQEALHVGFKTVRTHLRNIFRKLGVHSRREACAAYVRGRFGTS
jgi:DNA-binding NarL/FixJ family response regulator